MSDNWIVRREEFRSITDLLSVLSNRPNNDIMRHEHSSSDNGNSRWYGTNSMSEAIKIMGEGYKDAIVQMKQRLEESIKINSKDYADVNHPVPHSAIVGYIPNVPNAIRGVPQSMISVDRKPMKRKTLQIMYSVGGSCQESREYFEKAGIALLTAVDLIERSGVQTCIDLAFFTGCESIPGGREATFPTVRIKNYGERFSLQKVSFPLVHTSMFRRIGFKWLETTPVITGDFTGGYGRPLNSRECDEAYSKLCSANANYLSVAWINENDCDVKKILEKLGVVS